VIKKFTDCSFTDCSGWLTVVFAALLISLSNNKHQSVYLLVLIELIQLIIVMLMNLMMWLYHNIEVTFYISLLEHILFDCIYFFNNAKMYICIIVFGHRLLYIKLRINQSGWIKTLCIYCCTGIKINVCGKTLFSKKQNQHISMVLLNNTERLS